MSIFQIMGVINLIASMMLIFAYSGNLLSWFVTVPLFLIGLFNIFSGG